MRDDGWRVFSSGADWIVEHSCIPINEMRDGSSTRMTAPELSVTQITHPQTTAARHTDNNNTPSIIFSHPSPTLPVPPKVPTHPKTTPTNHHSPYSAPHSHLHRHFHSHSHAPTVAPAAAAHSPRSNPSPQTRPSNPPSHHHPPPQAQQQQHHPQQQAVRHQTSP